MIILAILANVVLCGLGLLLGLAGLFRWWTDANGPPDEEG